jgi:hypothetical protein
MRFLWFSRVSVETIWKQLLLSRLRCFRNVVGAGTRIFSPLAVAGLCGTIGRYWYLSFDKNICRTLFAWTKMTVVLGCSWMEIPDLAGGNRVMFMQDHPLAVYLAQTDGQAKI